MYKIVHFYNVTDYNGYPSKQHQEYLDLIAILDFKKDI